MYKHISTLSGSHGPKLPLPAFNVINGGVHAGNELPIQEIMVIPTKATSFSEAMKIGTEVYQSLKQLLSSEYGRNGTFMRHLLAINVGDEGGFAPGFRSINEALDVLMKSIAMAGYTEHVSIGLDVAASGTRLV